MKKINIFFLMLMGMIIITFSSCNSSQSFVVKGVPGTIIYNPQNQQVGIIDNSGESEIRMSRGDGYYHYLQAQVPGSSMLVPFALDYKNNSRAGKRGLLKMGELTLGATSIALSAGLVILAIAGEEGAIFGILGGADIACAFGGMACALAISPGIESDYDYQTQQVTNNDIQRW